MSCIAQNCSIPIRLLCLIYSQLLLTTQFSDSYHPFSRGEGLFIGCVVMISNKLVLYLITCQRTFKENCSNTHLTHRNHRCNFTQRIGLCLALKLYLVQVYSLRYSEHCCCSVPLRFGQSAKGVYLVFSGDLPPFFM